MIESRGGGGITLIHTSSSWYSLGLSDITDSQRASIGGTSNIRSRVSGKNVEVVFLFVVSWQILCLYKLRPVLACPIQ